MTNNQKQQKPVKWDIFYSTYYWRIYLDKTHPLNSPNVEFLKGYSKQERQNEASDLHHLLKAKILNLHQNGYFDRMLRIEIWQRLGEIINTKTDAKFLILYPKNYDINPAYQDYTFKTFAPFLNDFYDRRNNEKSMEGIIKQKRKPMSLDDRLNISKVHLHSLQQLYSYAARLLVNGHPEGAVNSFIQKYRELKKW